MLGARVCCHKVFAVVSVQAFACSVGFYSNWWTFFTSSVTPPTPEGINCPVTSAVQSCCSCPFAIWWPEILYRCSHRRIFVSRVLTLSSISLLVNLWWDSSESFVTGTTGINDSRLLAVWSSYVSVSVPWWSLRGSSFFTHVPEMQIRFRAEVCGQVDAPGSLSHSLGRSWTAKYQDADS